MSYDDLLYSNIPEYTVSEISNGIRATVEQAFAYVRVRGEISGYKTAPSGHVYYNLKDDKCLIAAVCWNGRSRSFSFSPEDGLEVICIGRITTYGARSSYQLVVEHMEIAGQGALMALLEKRKKQLEKEGLFDASRKKTLPFLPERIGIITSPTGAVIEDILHRIEDRFPRHLLLWPVQVQGEGAANQIAKAINGFNSLAMDCPKRPDVIIIARGGGSIEDLWTFNEEIVVRATANSTIPIISAVGHETDTTLIDFAADKRAPTPTAAAEFAVPLKAELYSFVHNLEHKLFLALTRELERLSEQMISLNRALTSPKQSIEFFSQRLDDLLFRLDGGWRQYHNQHWQYISLLSSQLINPKVYLESYTIRIVHISKHLHQGLQSFFTRYTQILFPLGKLLESYSYHHTLKRGFALVRNQDGTIIQSGLCINEKNALTIEFHDATIQVTTESNITKNITNAIDGTKHPKKKIRKNNIYPTKSTKVTQQETGSKQYSMW